MKTTILSLFAAFAFVGSASAQNEVPEAPVTNKVPPQEENVYAPTQVERQRNTAVTTEQYNERAQQATVRPQTDPANQPMAAPAPAAMPVNNSGSSKQTRKKTSR